MLFLGVKFNYLLQIDNQGPEYTIDNGRRRKRAETSGNKPMEIRDDGPNVGASSERKNIVLFVSTFAVFIVLV